ncbi:MAG TPA: MBL fold metallo-hydrolase [Minicystis sp.]|nr:MBL fold metallo-hydrolase [Minicystis sp.]
MNEPRVVVLAFAAAALAACSPTLPAAPPHAFVAPAVDGPPLDVCWLEYARDSQPGSYGLAGSSDATTWQVTFSGLLVRHPKGHVLIDVGPSTHFGDEIATSGFFARVLQRFVQGAGARVATAPEALRSVGEDAARLRGIVLTHVHADHAGGVMDLPKVPVLLSADELAFAEREKDQGGFDVVLAEEREIAKRAEPIRFAARPYENFDRSFDLFGDGAVVLVPLAGHTPGSLGVFVTRSPRERFFLVGDATNLEEAIEKRRGKSVVIGFTDHDGAEADRVVAKLTQLHALDPGLVFVPAHDRTAWARAFAAPGRCLGAR